MAVIVVMWILWNCLLDQSQRGGAEGEMGDHLAEVEAGEVGGLTLVRGPVGVLVNWAATSTQVRIKQTNNHHQKQTRQTSNETTNKQTFAGQAEAIVRSAAAATAGQDHDFVDDPVFDELFSADGSDSNVGTVMRGNPGWF